MASNMARSHAAVVPASITEEADIGGWSVGEDVTIRLVRAIVAGCEWGMDHGEVAQELGRPSANAARVAIHRALVRLAKEMARGH